MSGSVVDPGISKPGRAVPAGRFRGIWGLFCFPTNTLCFVSSVENENTYLYPLHVSFLQSKHMQVIQSKSTKNSTGGKGGEGPERLSLIRLSGSQS